MRAAVAALLVAIVAAGCGGASGLRPAAAVLVIDCSVGDAALWVDERFVAEVREARRGVRLPPGRHRIEIRQDRYHAYYGEVALAAGERRTLSVPLAERLE